jgi:ATP-dependent Zn protease
VTFMPSQPGSGGPRSVLRTILFWVMMIALAAVLWQMANNGKSQKSIQSVSYSDFMSSVDQNNIASAKLLLSQSTAEIEGTFRQPATDFKVTIPKKVIPDLTERLRKQGTPVEVVEVKNANRLSVVITLAPFVVIVAIWIFVMKGRLANQSPPAGAPRPMPTSGLGRVRSFANSANLIIHKAMLWIAVMGLIAVLSSLFWGQSSVHELTPSEFIQQLDLKNVHDAKLLTSKGDVEVTGELLQPIERFHVSAEQQHIQDLAYRLQQAGVPTATAAIIPRRSAQYYAIWLFIIGFLAAWFALMRFKIRKLELRSQQLKVVREL